MKVPFTITRWFIACVLTLMTLMPGAPRALAAGAADRPTMPPYRIEAGGFGASEADIRAVLDSAGHALWRHFGDWKIEPMVVVRGTSGPITLYARNERGEIVVKLDTGETYWCQYAYQFAHEFCHVLCGLKEGNSANKWFEETLCETASLYALREMARTWKKSPPYPNWRDYRDSLRQYADDVILKRDLLLEMFSSGLPAFYERRRDALRRNATDREANGAMAVALLHVFEKNPAGWESIRWLNSTPVEKDDTFARYLEKWHDAVPERHRDFVGTIAALFGVRAGARAATR